ncbi:Formate dehydrogenase [Abortiporus biennis]
MASASLQQAEPERLIMGCYSWSKQACYSPLPHDLLKSHQLTIRTTPNSNMKILAILYQGGNAAKEEPRLLGTVENELGLREWLTSLGHEFIVSDDKEGPDSVFEKNIVDAEVLITTPFHPGYLTADLINKAKNLKICITAGVGSDHVDLNAARSRAISVLEVTGSNVVSVAEHVVMSILLLVRNFVPAHEMIERGDWQVSDIARNAFDLEGKVVGTIGAGRIGYRVLQRLVPFNVKELLYYDYNPLPEQAAKDINVRRVEKLEDFVSQCDVVTVNCPLHEGTRGLVNADLLKHFKKGAWLVNTARGAICDKDAVAAALKSGQLSGYSGDVWNVQPAPKDHVWRTMKNPLGGGNGMVPHYSGTTLDAQARYAAGTKEILENYFNGAPQTPANIIVDGGKYVTGSYGQR